MNGNSAAQATNANQQYRQIITDMLQELNQVLDDHVVVKIARGVPGLTVADTGQVEAIEGDPQAVVQGVVDQFVGLSNKVVVKTLQPLLRQCPWIKVPGVS